jgi:hypothetical protein
LILDAYRQEDASRLRQALEVMFGPRSGTCWASGGVYVFWRPDTREPLYVGITGDFPERFAQHHGFRSCPLAGCKRQQIEEYFANEYQWLGYTVLALSSLSQQSTRRQRQALGLTERELIELNEALSAEVVDATRALEGRLLAAHHGRFGGLPRWNDHPGRRPGEQPDPDDATLALVVGVGDCLLQARRTLRQVGEDGVASLYEEQLHAARMLMLGSFTNSGFREFFANFWGASFRDEILTSGYLDERCPVTIGEVLP